MIDWKAAAFCLGAACPQALYRSGTGQAVAGTVSRHMAGRAAAEAQATPNTLGLARAVLRKAKGERPS